MQHKEFVSALSRKDLADLQARDDGAGLRHLAGHLGAIVLLALYIGFSSPLWPLAILPLGIALVFLFTLEHEATHKTPFKTERLNEGVGHVAGLLILQPFLWFRYFHLAHHRHTNIPGKDPELLAGHKPETWSAYVWHVSGLPYWIGMSKQLLINAMGRDPGDYVPKSARPKVIKEARRILAIYALVALSLFATDLMLWI